MFHPLSKTYLDNPYDIFTALHTEQPIFFHEELKLWIVSRYEDVQYVIKDSETFSNSLSIVPISPVCPHALAAMKDFNPGNLVVTSDPPIHTRLRKAISATFPVTLKKANLYEDVIRKRVHQFLDRLSQKKEADLVTEFAQDVPILVLMEILGVPDEDLAKIKQFTREQVPFVWGQAPEEQQVEAARGTVDLFDYGRELVEKRLKNPSEDLISELIAYRNDEDEILTIQEIGGIVASYFSAGIETVRNLITNGVLQLLRTKGVWQELSQHPEKIPNAVEEILRYESPVTGWLRFSVKDSVVGGVEIPAHQRILVLLGAANRDEEQFLEADVFQIDRDNANKNLAFSAGRHHCFGSALARVEAKVIFEELVTRFPNMRLAERFQPNYVPNIAFRTLTDLPVVLF
ncbi:cytochrome P450 [Shimazuella alba]|uniref:Cytochrome P450 n=1 Tax=Shimazuella alba TaxID=2690964 RepID=A0A6I4VXE6_9BACL|nr:cytochrome P450 [Shimazuella alba]MXQ55258.1 cytochrome P450 [Shimazuella alba]